MTRQVLCCLVFYVAGMGFADSPSLLRQGPAPLIPPPAASSNTPVPMVKEKPVALTPLEEAKQLYRMGEFDEAITHLHTALQSNPKLLRAHYNLANIWLQKGDIDQAIINYQQELQIQPQFAEGHNNLASALFRKGRLDEAQEHIRASQVFRSRVRVTVTRYIRQRGESTGMRKKPRGQT